MDSLSGPELHNADPSALGREEAHMPVIEAPYVVAAGEMFPVTIKVGRNPHVMEGGHYIRFTDLYAEDAFLTRVAFTPIIPKPKFTCFLAINESTKLRAVTFCSLHGYWEAEQWIRVS